MYAPRRSLCPALPPSAFYCPAAKILKGRGRGQAQVEQCFQGAGLVSFHKRLVSTAAARGVGAARLSRRPALLPGLSGPRSEHRPQSLSVSPQVHFISGHTEARGHASSSRGASAPGPGGVVGTGHFWMVSVS